MITSIIVQAVFKLTMLVLGILLARAALLWFDLGLNKYAKRRSGEVPAFIAWYRNASTTDRAIYYAARNVGIFLAVAIVIG